MIPQQQRSAQLKSLHIQVMLFYTPICENPFQLGVPVFIRAGGVIAALGCPSEETRARNAGRFGDDQRAEQAMSGVFFRDADLSEQAREGIRAGVNVDG